MNPFLAALLGYSRQHMIGMKLWELGPFKDTVKSKIAFEALQSNAYIRYEDLPLETDDGRTVEVEFVSNVYVAGGKNIIQCNIRDISKRKRADAQSHLRSAALDATATPIVITDSEGAIEWVNPAFSDLTGYTAAEAFGRHPHELAKSTPKGATFLTLLWDTIGSGRVWRGELVSRRKDGSAYAEEQTITPVHDTDGAVRHFIAVKQDITERKSLEEESSARMGLQALRAAIDLALSADGSLTDALAQCADALITHLSAAAARIWTFDADGRMLVLQASVGAWTEGPGTGVDVPSESSVLARIARDGAPYVTNDAVGDPNVSDQPWVERHWVVAFAGYPLIVQGHTIGVMALTAGRPLSAPVVSTLAFVADHLAAGIQHRRDADARELIEARTRFALESANVGIWDLDLTTDAFSWSPEMFAQFGAIPETFGGTWDTFMERVHPDDRAAVVEARRRGEQVGGAFSVSPRVIRPDGTVRWMREMGRVVDGANGNRARAVGISLDITDQHMLEVQFRQAQKMEAVGRLAGGVAHDFNNLLTSILGFSELLLGDLKPDDPHRADVVEIQRAGIIAASLTRQLLAFSRQEVVAPRLLDLNAVTAEMRSMLERLIGEDIAVVLNLCLGSAMVKVDRGQLEQVIMNLAVNARDAMRDGGQLTIATSMTFLDEAYAEMHAGVTPGAYVALSVTDTGTGMTPEV